MLFVFLSVLALIYFVHVYSKHKYNFWSKKGVKGSKPTLLVGNFGKVITLQQGVRKTLDDVYKQYSNEKIVGLYQGLTPILLLRDPEVINHVLIKDFSVFQERGRKLVTGGSKLDKNLFTVDAKTWRIFRQKLTPLFSSKQIKDMVPLIEQCVDNYIKYLEYLTEHNVNHEIRHLKSKYTLQVIGSCVFGLNLDTFNNKDDEFSINAKKIYNPSIIPKILWALNMIIPGIRNLNPYTKIQDFFCDLVPKFVNERKNKPKTRKYFMDLMIDLREQGRISRNDEQGQFEMEIDDDFVAAQAFLIYAAGFETSAATMSFMIYELALHQDVQNKVYEEICNVTARHDGKIIYESVNEMTYLEMAIHETLRIHTVSNFNSRKALADYVLPGVNVSISKGTLLYISLTGLHTDENYYENAEDFNPENFSSENIRKRPHCTYLGFGDGPRNCIGKRFAMIMTMMGMSAFLRKFRVEPSDQTKSTLQYNPTGITLESKHGIWVKILKGR